MISKFQEVPVEKKLRDLYDLQLIDSRIDEINSLIENFPIEIHEIENEVKKLQNKVEKIQKEISVYRSSLQKKKEIIKEDENYIKKYKTQQDKILNHRELKSLSKEIEYQELEIELANKNIKDFEIQLSQKESLLEKDEILYKKKKEHVLKKRKELYRVIQNYQKEQKILLKYSVLFSKKIEPNLLNKYNSIRSKVKNGLAIVTVDRGASGGSFFIIPTQEYLDIIQRQKIVIDAHSGCIVIDAALAEEERKRIFDYQNFIDH